MTIPTHCPSVAAGTLAAGQIPPCHIGPTTVRTVDPGAGSRRAVYVFRHPSITSDAMLPLAIPNSTTEFGDNISYVSGQGASHAAVHDGWVFDYPPSPVDHSVNAVGYPKSLYNAVVADSGHGSAFVETEVATWQHILQYIHDRFGHVGVFIDGFSLGAYEVLVALTNLSSIPLSSMIVGAAMHCPVTDWGAIVANGFASLPTGANWSGMTIGTHALDTVPFPVLVGYSTTDGTVGYSATSTPASNIDSIITNAQAAAKAVTRYASSADAGATYPLGHLFLPQDAVERFSGANGGTAGTGYVETVIDPLVPANAF